MLLNFITCEKYRNGKKENRKKGEKFQFNNMVNNTNFNTKNF